MLQAQLGYAADRYGHGVAYARLTTRAGERLVRAAFRIARFPGLDGREVAYGALTAIAAMLSARGIDRVRFLLPDESLIADRREHRPLPPPIELPYVRLGCALNRFAAFDLQAGEDRDLSARAVAEVELHTAA